MIERIKAKIEGLDTNIQHYWDVIKAAEAEIAEAEKKKGMWAELLSDEEKAAPAELPEETPIIHCVACDAMTSECTVEAVEDKVHEISYGI